MPSEYVMYLSMLLVGALAIAGISATMMSLNSTMADRAIRTELENIMQKISDIIYNLKEEGQREVEAGEQSVNLIVMLNLPDNIQNEAYTIAVNSTSSSYLLYGTLVHRTDIKVSVSLFIPPSELNMSGALSSSSSSAKVRFSYDGQTIRILLET